MTSWIKESICERFNTLSSNVEHLEEVLVLKQKIAEVMKRNELSEDAGRLFEEVNQLHDEMVSIHNQWFYVKGVQDGIQLLMFLLWDEGEKVF